MPVNEILLSYITNLFGMMLIFTVIMGNPWYIYKRNSREYIWVSVAAAACFFACLIDPIARILEGIPGYTVRKILLIVDSLLFILPFFCFPVWSIILSIHFRGRTGKCFIIIYTAESLLGILLLIYNVFDPQVFSLSRENVYQRGPLYQLFFFANAGFSVWGFLIYLLARLKRKGLKTFPVWAYMCPALFGGLIQYFFPGISVVWPFASITTAGLAAGLKNEFVFVDGLTGIYNRYFLDNIERDESGKRNAEYTLFFYDLNGFKEINDSYGHLEGDEALKKFASILSEAAGISGTAVRYGGDEFCIMLSSIRETDIREVLDSVKNSIREYNNTSGKAYRISAAEGHKKFNLNKHSIQEVMGELDRLMYNDKNEYYKKLDRIEKLRRKEKSQDEGYWLD